MPRASALSLSWGKIGNLGWRKLGAEFIKGVDATTYRDDQKDWLRQSSSRAGWLLRLLPDVQSRRAGVWLATASPARGTKKALSDDQAVIRRAYERLDSLALNVANGTCTERSEYLPKIFSLIIDSLRDASLLISRLIFSNCAVTFKVLWQDSMEVSIKSLLRDPVSSDLRSHYSPPNGFPPEDNSAFETLLFSSNKEYFSADNLIALEAKGEYKNNNPVWKELYNSTAVSPVRNKSTGVIIGFLCADTKSGNLTDKQSGDRVRDILDGFSDLLYYAIRAANDGFGLNEEEIGWRVQSEQLSPLNPTDTQKLQDTYRLMEALYLQNNPHAKRGKLPRISLGKLASSHYKKGVQDVDEQKEYEELMGLSWHDVKEPWASNLTRETSFKEFIKTLKKIAPYDEYASTLLERARKMGHLDSD